VRTATQIASAVRRGESSASAELAVALAAIEARNEELHVFLHVDAEGAAARSRSTTVAV
jgi:Asp-tRNA(Asn)/Glu-tRNA(Gln) amidotransferase A subunit family amidase